MNCEHDWQVVTTESHADGRVLNLFCELCRTSAHLYLTGTECDEIQARMDELEAGWSGDDIFLTMTIRDMVHDLANRPDMQPRVWIRSTHAGGGDDDLLTAGDDDQIDALGTMSWTVIEDGVFNDEAAAEFRAHIFDGIDHAPAECNHTWHVRGVAGEEAAESEIELYCLRCHKWATVPDLTDYECEIIGRAWLLGLALEWQDTKRVQLHRDAPPANGETSIDGDGAPDEPRPPVADLVDVLDLFEGEDDEDIPF